MAGMLCSTEADGVVLSKPAAIGDPCSTTILLDAAASLCDWWAIDGAPGEGCVAGKVELAGAAGASDGDGGGQTGRAGTWCKAVADGIGRVGPGSIDLLVEVSPVATNSERRSISADKVSRLAPLVPRNLAPATAARNKPRNRKALGSRPCQRNAFVFRGILFESWFVLGLDPGFAFGITFISRCL
jgi:hypothetical protein